MSALTQRGLAANQEGLSRFLGTTSSAVRLSWSKINSSSRRGGLLAGNQVSTRLPALDWQNTVPRQNLFSTMLDSPLERPNTSPRVGMQTIGSLCTSSWANPMTAVIRTAISAMRVVGRKFYAYARNGAVNFNHP